METFLSKIGNLFILKAYGASSTMINLPSKSKWSSFDQVLNTVLVYLVWFAVAACFIFFSIGALQYIFGNGDPSSLNKARTSMLWSALGLVVIIIGYVMLKWVGGFFGYTSIF